MSETHNAVRSEWNGVERRAGGNNPRRVAIVFDREQRGPGVRTASAMSGLAAARARVEALLAAELVPA